MYPCKLSTDTCLYRDFDITYFIFFIFNFFLEKPAILGQTVWCTNIADAILKSDMVETRLDKVRSSSDSEKKPRTKSQPEKTIVYTVKAVFTLLNNISSQKFFN